MMRPRRGLLGLALLFGGPLLAAGCRENLPPYAFETSDAGEASAPDSAPPSDSASPPSDAGDAAKDTGADGQDGETDADLDGNQGG
jgi:hypothetical protein